MPLYVIIRSFDMFFDGGILSERLGFDEGISTGPKVGSHHDILGRLSIPIVVAVFMSFVDASKKIHAGRTLYVEHGFFEAGIAFIIPFLIGFIIVKQFLNVPFIWLTILYGRLATNLSYLFEPFSAEEYQLGRVTASYQQQDTLGQLIKEREVLIKDIKYAIVNDISYSRCDSSRSDKELSIKALEKEERMAFGK